MMQKLKVGFLVLNRRVNYFQVLTKQMKLEVAYSISRMMSRKSQKKILFLGIFSIKDKQTNKRISNYFLTVENKPKQTNQKILLTTPCQKPTSQNRRVTSNTRNFIRRFSTEKSKSLRPIRCQSVTWVRFKSFS